MWINFFLKERDLSLFIDVKRNDIEKRIRWSIRKGEVIKKRGR